MINGALAQIYLTVGPWGPQTHPLVISPILKCIFGIDIFGSWGESLCWFPDLYNEDYYGSKGQMQDLYAEKYKTLMKAIKDLHIFY